MDKISKLFNIIKDTEESDYNSVTYENEDFFLLENLCNIRENVFSWIPIKDGESILQVGTGNGAVSNAFWKKKCYVDCLVDDEVEEKIVCTRVERNHHDNDCIHIIRSELKAYLISTDKKYDYIFFTESYFSNVDEITNTLECCMNSITEQGEIYFVSDNIYGLKGLAGCRDAYTGDFYSAIEGYVNHEGTRGFSRQEIGSAILKISDADYEMYYPYPDYRYTFQLFSDNRLPKSGELANNLLQFDSGRMLLFDETAAFEQIIKDGRFIDFSNSYLVRVRKNKTGKQNNVIYVKYSNDRATEYQIRTEITLENGKLHVYKYTESESAKLHIDTMFERYKHIQDMLECSVFELNKTNKITNGLEFEYLVGNSLEEELDKLLYGRKITEFKALFDRFCSELRDLAKTEFSISDNFEKVFGKCPDAVHGKSMAVSDVDMIFKNIILCNGKWNVLDYEWSYDFTIPIDFVIYRAVHYYQEGERNSYIRKYMNLYEVAGITEKYRDIYNVFERNFQRYINGKCISIRDIYDKVSPPLIQPISEAIRKSEEAESRCVEVVVTDVDGSQNKSSFYPSEDRNGIVKYGIRVDEKIASIELVFAKRCCSVDIVQSLAVSDTGLKKVRFETDGIENFSGSYIYTGDKAGIIINDIPSDSNGLYFEWHIEYLSGDLLMHRILEYEKMQQRIVGEINENK